MSKPTVSFNSSDFASTVPFLIIVGTDPYKTPGRTITNTALANVNKSVTSSAYFQQKRIAVKVEIGAPDRDTLESSIDALEQILQTKEAALVFVQNGANRQYTATMESIVISDAEGGWAALTVTFVCSDPYGYATSTTNLFSSSRTGSSSTESFIVAGSVLTQCPVITLTLTALTGGTNATIVITNSATGQSITVTGTRTAGDVLVIDCLNRTVKVNGAEVAFTGAFPEWAPGAGTLSYSDTLTTRTFTLAGVYTKRYL